MKTGVRTEDHVRESRRDWCPPSSERFFPHFILASSRFPASLVPNTPSSRPPCELFSFFARHPGVPLPEREPRSPVGHPTVELVGPEKGRRACGFRPRCCWASLAVAVSVARRWSGRPVDGPPADPHARLESGREGAETGCRAQGRPGGRQPAQVRKCFFFNSLGPDAAPLSGPEQFVKVFA